MIELTARQQRSIHSIVLSSGSGREAIANRSRVAQTTIYYSVDYTLTRGGLRVLDAIELRDYQLNERCNVI